VAVFIMKTSVIRRRVADFLKQFPPFDQAPQADLLELAGAGRVQFLESETYIYWRGKPWPDRVWVIQQGSVELLEEADGAERRMDLLGAGECLGLERYLGEPAPPHAARTTSDVILYSLESAAFDAFRRHNPGVERFLAAHRTEASPTMEPARADESWLFRPLPPFAYLNERTGSRPKPAELPHVTPEMTAGACYCQMLRAGSEALEIRHGDEHAAMDAATLSLVTGWDPVRVCREFDTACQDEPLRYLAGRAREQITSAITSPKAVQLGSELGSLMSARFAQTLIRRTECADSACWVMLGRSGRRELLDLEAPQLAVICPGGISAADLSGHQAALDRVTEKLSELGLAEPIDADDRGNLCLSLPDWEARFGRMIQDPIGTGAYVRRALLDQCHLAGPVAGLSHLRQFIQRQMAECPAFLRLLANDTQDHLPPLTFYEGLVVDLDGREKSSVDLFEKAMGPLADAARVLALTLGELAVTNTAERLRLAAAASSRPGVMESAVLAFDTVAYFESVQRRKRPGQAGHLDPSQVSRYDQRLLKTAFGAIQALLEYVADAPAGWRS
jgi:signal-transduction protein with cAMP-binding, CBS, and nucleotidyltransferase domain